MRCIYIVIALFLSVPLDAAIYYVDDVSTNGNGTQGSPYNSIRDALEMCDPGDKVLIYPGVYDLTAAIQSKKNGLSNQPITIEGIDPFNRPVIRRSERILLIEHPHHIVRNLIMDSKMSDATIVKVRDGAHGTQIINCEVKNAKQSGIDIRHSNNVLVKNCVVHHCLRGSFTNQVDAHGIVAVGHLNLRIENTEIYYVSGDAFQTDPVRDTPLWDNTLIKDCHFWTGPLPADAGGWNAGESPGENGIDTKVIDNPSSGYRPRLHIDGLLIHGYTNNGYIPLRAAFAIKEQVEVILNRVVAYDNQIVFRLVGDNGNGSANVEIKNSIAYGNDAIFRLMSNVESVKIYQSTFDANSASAYLEDDSYEPGGLVVKNCLFTNLIPSDFQDPSNMIANNGFFVDRSAGDYHLVCGSPAVNAGIDLNGVTTDFDNDQRTPGSYDVGADELDGESAEMVLWDNGANNGLWSSSHNWSNNTTPHGCSSVMIQGNYSIMVDHDAQARTIEVKAGNEFFVPIGSELEITGF